MEKLSITLEQLKAFSEKHPELLSKLNVQTERIGEYTPICKVVEKSDKLVSLDIGGEKVRCGEYHIFKRHDNRFMLARDIGSEGSYIKISGGGKILVKQIPPPITYGKVIDIQIAYPHLYSLSEDVPVISHNTLYLANYVATAIKNGYDCIVFTMEDGEKKWAGRIDQNIMQMTRDELLAKGKEALPSFLSKIKESFGKLKLVTLPTGTANVNMMREKIDYLKKEEGFDPDLIVSDYLGIMSPTQPYNNSYEKYKLVAEEFRSLGPEYQSATVSAQQFNRGAFGGGGKGKRPGIDQVQDSIGIPQTADAIVTIMNMTGDDSGNKHILEAGKSRSTNKRNIKSVVVTTDTDRQTIISSEDFVGPVDKSVQEELKTIGSLAEGKQSKGKRRLPGAPSKEKKKMKIATSKTKEDLDDLLEGEI